MDRLLIKKIVLFLLCICLMLSFVNVVDAKYGDKWTDSERITYNTKKRLLNIHCKAIVGKGDTFYGGIKCKIFVWKGSKSQLKKALKMSARKGYHKYENCFKVKTIALKKINIYKSSKYRVYKYHKKLKLNKYGCYLKKGKFKGYVRKFNTDYFKNIISASEYFGRCYADNYFG